MLLQSLITLLFIVACSKPSKEDSRTSQLTPSIGERYDVSYDEAWPLILEATERRIAYAQGMRECESEKTLQEAVWLAEALMNYDKGDATRSGDDWISGSIEYTFRVYVKQDGTVWIRECDFYASYSDALQAVTARVGDGKIYLLDHELAFIEGDLATMRIEWSDKDPSTDQLPEPWAPDGSGWDCMTPQEAGIAIKHLINNNYHGTEPPVGSFIVNVTPPYHIDAVEEIGYFGSYPYYLGTSEQLGGPHLFYSGPGGDVVCFPEWWNRYVQARELIVSGLILAPGMELVREKFWADYIPRTGQPMTYGSPFYPMGPWDFQWEFRKGYVLQPIGPE